MKYSKFIPCLYLVRKVFVTDFQDEQNCTYEAQQLKQTAVIAADKWYGVVKPLGYPGNLLTQLCETMRPHFVTHNIDF